MNVVFGVEFYDTISIIRLWYEGIRNRNLQTTVGRLIIYWPL